eukprot:scpid64001/ scgid34658/ 
MHQQPRTTAQCQPIFLSKMVVRCIELYPLADDVSLEKGTLHFSTTRGGVLRPRMTVDVFDVVPSAFSSHDQVRHAHQQLSSDDCEQLVSSVPSLVEHGLRFCGMRTGAATTAATQA